MTRPALLLFLLASPLSALAAGFAAVDGVVSHVDPKSLSGSADIGAIQFRFGSALNSEATLGMEFRAGLGFGRERSNGVRYEMDRYFGAYLRGQFPADLVVRPYGLIGVSRIETTQNGSGENYNDLSLGLGADYNVNETVFVSLEYLRAADRSKAEVSNFSLGVGARF